jgi:hypothetical protein
MTEAASTGALERVARELAAERGIELGPPFAL